MVSKPSQQTVLIRTNSDFSVKHKVTYGPEEQIYQTHNQFDIIFIMTANTSCHINEKNWKIPEHSLLLFNNMNPHKIVIPAGERFERYILSFKPEYIESLSSKDTDLLECFFFRPFSNPYILPLTSLQITECLSYLNQIMACNELSGKRKYGYDMKNKFLLGNLLIFINSAYREYHGFHSLKVNASYSLIYSIINHIHTHLGDELSLDSLSAEFFMNKYHLCKVFKTVTDFSPNQYIINCRIMKAKELLSQNVSVDMVCGLVGYKNLSHFSRIFKQYTGLSPKQYAKFKQVDAIRP